MQRVLLLASCSVVRPQRTLAQAVRHKRTPRPCHRALCSFESPTLRAVTSLRSKTGGTKATIGGVYADHVRTADVTLKKAQAALTTAQQRLGLSLRSADGLLFARVPTTRDGLTVECKYAPQRMGGAPEGVEFTVALADHSAYAGHVLFNCRVIDNKAVVVDGFRTLPESETALSADTDEVSRDTTPSGIVRFEHAHEEVQKWFVLNSRLRRRMRLIRVSEPP